LTGALLLADTARNEELVAEYKLEVALKLYLVKKCWSIAEVGCLCYLMVRQLDGCFVPRASSFLIKEATDSVSPLSKINSAFKCL
jgi:hypothetical protein